MNVRAIPTAKLQDMDPDINVWILKKKVFMECSLVKLSDVKRFACRTTALLIKDATMN